MTKNEALGLSQLLIKIAEEYFVSGTKMKMSDSLFHAVKRNIRKLAPLTKEHVDTKNDIQEAFKKKDGFSDKDLEDEKKAKSINERFSKFLEDSETEADFLKEDFKVELYKIEEAEIVNAIILPAVEASLLKYLKK